MKKHDCDCIKELADTVCLAALFVWLFNRPKKQKVKPRKTREEKLAEAQAKYEATKARYQEVRRKIKEAKHGTN
ncbi:MAG: hypothetical protein E7622_01850 [Ruminococcaceae bacterium]|nr:hypothetical protein [Oscillospiraceae bacterium]